jgi:integrase
LVRAAFREVAQEYLAHYHLRKRDRQTMAFQIRVFVRHFGEADFGSIGEREIEAFFAARQAEGRSGATCNRNLSALIGLWRWAVERGHAERDPVAAMPRFPESPEEARYLSPEEIAQLILAAAPHLKAFLIALTYSGARMTEMLRLRWGRVDLKANAITFTRETTKGRRTRIVPIVPELREALVALRPGPPDAFVFVYNGRPVASMRTALRSAARRAGLGRIGFHTLRHSFARFFIERDGPVVLLQRILGHSTIGMTMRYVHTSPGYVSSGARFMGPPRRKDRPAGEQEPE